MDFKNYLSSSKRTLCRLLPGATFSVLVAAFLLSMGNVTLAQTAFTCQNGVSYQIQGNPSALYQIDLRTGTPTLLSTAAALGNRNLTGLGYNPLNNFLYASVSGTNTILRIGASGTPTLITVPTLPALAYTAGDVGPDGSLYLYVSSSASMYKVNLTTLAVTTLSLTDGATLSDFSVNKEGTMIYGISASNGNLVSYATTGGARTAVVVGMPSGILNSSFIDSNNNLYVIQDDNSQVYEIVGPNKSPNATTATQLTTASTVIANTDGARCINSTATTQTPFICAAGTGFVVSGTLGYSSGNCTDLGNSILSTYNLANNTVTSTTSQLINSFNSRTTVNNLGYNTKDNFLWGYRNGTNQLVRIGSGPSVGTTRAVDFFAIDGLSTTCAYTFGTTNNTVFLAGDINTNGIMYLFNGLDGNTIVRVDLNPASSTYLQKLSDITLSPANLTPAGGASDIADMAFNPIDGNLYTVNANLRLLRINPTTGVISDLGAVTGLTGANGQNFLIAFFDNSGALYVQQGQASTLYKIPNVATGSLAGSVQTTGAQSVGGNGDGARCPLSSIETYTLSGTIFNDANGLLGTPANTIDGTPVSTLNGNTLSVNLVNSTTGLVLRTTTLTNGTYSFTGVSSNTSYSIVLTNTPGVVANDPPSTALTGVANTGEFIGTGAGSDGNPNGVISVSVAAANIANINFGIDRLPVADAKSTTSVPNPGGTVRVSVPTLTGSDAEDGTYTGVTNSNTIVIQSLPGAAGTLYYNNAVVTLGQVIANYNPTLLFADPADGPVSVTFTYSERDAAGKDSPPALVTIPFTDALISISGTVYNDANGLLGTPANTVDGTAVSTLAGNTFRANLVGPAGTVVASTTLTSGTYSFTGVTPNASYSVVLSNTAGVVGSAPPSATLTGSVVNTGENIGAGAGSDGTPNGIIAVVVTTTNVTNVNFGVDRLPTADAKTATTVPNPGGLNRTTVPTLTGSDPEDGTYTGVTNSNTVVIQSLPTNGTLYYSNVAVTAGQVIPNYNPTLLMIDPIDGPVSVTFTYSERDAAGKDSPAALVTIPFTDALVAISGTVFNDANGLLGTPANTVDGSPVNTLAGNTFYANLVGPAGTVVASTTLTSGTYSFAGVTPNASYSVVLSNTAGVVGSAPPSTTLTGSVVNTGENVGAGAGSDGTPNGIIAVPVTTVSVTNVNFGVDRLPTADAKTVASVPNPGGTNRVTAPTLTGSDPEDGTYTGVSNTNTIVIQTLPTAATGILYYNNVAVTAGQVIPNYNPTLLTLDPADGPVNVTFTYSERDAAGKDSPTALVTIPFSNALVAISGTVFNDANGLLGTPANTVDGTPVSTLAGNTFYANLVNAAGTVVASTTLTSGTYSFTGIAPTTSYSVVLSNTAGVVGSASPSATLTGGVVNTGENIGAGAGSDGTPNGIIAVAVTTTNVTNVNFGVDRLPTADPKTVASQSNPGGTLTVVVPTLTGSDPEDGTYTGVTNSNTVVIQTLPGANGILYYNNVAVTAGQVIPNYNPSLLTLDPASGPVSVTFTYSERDAAGKDSPAALVTIPFSDALVAISGTVFNDANGLLGTPANTVDGTPVSTLAGNTFYANLVNAATGNVIASTTLTSGTYSFTGVTPFVSYSVVLSNTAGTVGSPPPGTALTGLANTGEFVGTGAGSDGNPNGIVAVAVGNTNVINVNFGVDRLPTADPKTAVSQSNPGGNNTVAVPTLTGSDPEDGTYTGVSNTNTIVIQALPAPALGVLFYNNVAVTAGQVITNYTPALLTVGPATGPVSVTFTYSERDAAGKDSPAALVTIPFTDALVAISGTVFNDANGLLGTPANTVDGSPVNTLAGNTFYANLVSATGNVIASTTLTSGTYSFTGVTPNASYSVVLSNTAGVVGSAPPSTTLTGSVVNTGENIGTTAGSDGTPNGIIAVAVTTNSRGNVNFGVDRLPVADAKTVASAPNPGGTNRVTAPTLTGSDPEDGTYTGVSNTNTVIIQTLPTAATGILYYNNVAVTAGQVITGYNPTLLTVDPADGPVSVTFTYSERDAAGKDSPAALVTIPFSDALVAISGTVFNDANGLLGTPANTVDGTPVSTLAGNTFYANLINAAGTVVASTTLTSGTYSFTGVTPNASYSVVLSNTAGTVGSVPPSTALTGLANTGEFVGTGAGSDGNPNGIVAVPVTTVSVTNVNFGVDRLPTADPKTAASQSNPGGNNTVAVPTLTGSDPEDGTYTGVSNTNTIVIQTLPTAASGILYYNGVAVTAGQVITSYNPTLLTLDPADGPVNVTFTYSERDAAGKDSPAALVTIPFSDALVAISGTVFNDANGLLGTPANTVDGTPVSTLAGNTFYANLVSAAGTVVASTTLTSGTYSFTGVTPNASYSVVLSNTAGTVGSVPPGTALTGGVVNTGENLGAGAGSDGTPNGVIALAVGASNVTSVNFGVDRLPVADAKTVASAPNPGGTNRVTAPTLTGSDPEDGTYTGVSNTNTVIIQTLPTAATGILYYNNVAVTAGQVITSYNPTLLTVDPADGPVNVTFTYSERDAAGKDSPAALVTIPFTDALITLSGNVFDDGNGLVDNLVNSIGNGPSPVNGTDIDAVVAGNQAIYATLVNSSNTAVQTVPVTAAGTYSFTGVAPNATYSVVLSTVAGGSLTPSLPTSWTNVGENLGVAAGSDGLANGVLTGIVVGTTAIINANFGIDQAPVVNSVTLTAQTNPGGTIAAPISSTAFTGSDLEDGTYATNLTGRTVILTPAVNGTLYYNGTAVTGTQTILSFDPTKVTLDPTATGATTGSAGAAPDPTFTYSVKDNAGVTSSPATVTVPFVLGIPDLTPIITALPATQYGTTNFTVVVDVYDLLAPPSNGLITLYVTKDPLVNLSFNPTAVFVGGRLVQNSIWTLDNTDPDFYIFTTTEVIAGRDRKTFGLTGVLTPGNTQGTLTISTTIVGGSGGEVRTNNNTDADSIDYFKK